MPFFARTSPAHSSCGWKRGRPISKSLGGTLKFAGPFLTEKEQTPCGSLVVIEAEDAEAAKAIADKDPYAEAGLFESVAIRPWVWAINNPGS